MVFSSLIFLWFFLPAVCLLSLLLRDVRHKNLLLLVASIFFYTWGEPQYVLLMLISIAANYGFGLLAAGRKRWALVLAVLVNLGLLGYFKYYNFFCELVGGLLGREYLPVREIALPIGISFYTFQALSYVVDVYRGTIKPQKSIWKLALYISFFPQLIAGPIVKYHDIEEQLDRRTVTAQKFAYGIKRFILGLAKKVLLANTFAAVVDQAFTSPALELLSRGMVLLAVLLYTLQIYYDFSGYSDMAIGLGQMFGFDFMENFRYPYLSRSVKEFWRRWHISLSAWFKEYLYIPLGGNRRGAARTYLNLLLVFFATGLWHGAGVNFVPWGLYHGFFLILERLFLGKVLDWLGKHRLGFLNRLYTIGVVCLGWMMFRVEELAQLGTLLRKILFNFQGAYTISMYMDCRLWFWLVVGVFFCGPVQMAVRLLTDWLEERNRSYWYDIPLLMVLLLLCLMLLVNNTYNPFIYFRF